MEVNQISTELMNLAGLAEEEQKQLKDALEKKKNVPAVVVEDTAGLELSISQLTEEPFGVVRDTETMNESGAKQRMTTDEAKRAILDKYRAKRNSHSILASTYPPIVSPSPKKQESDTGKLLYASGARNETKPAKRKSWFGKRKKSKNMKPIKKLSKETRTAILNMGKLNGNRAKSVVTEDETDIPTVIQLNKTTSNDPSRPPDSTEREVVRDESFSDSVSTLSHHVYGDGNWAEHGVSSLLNSVLSVGHGRGDKRSPALDEQRNEPTEGMLKDLSKDETIELDSEIFGWKSFTDEKSGYTYYQDPITRETTWTSPTKNQTPVGSTCLSNANTSGKGTVDTNKDSLSANVMLPRVLDAENRDEECNSVSGTECSENDTNPSQGDGETYDNTVGSFSTSRDVTWLELGVSKVIDVSFSVKSEMGEDENAGDAALEAPKSSATCDAQPDSEAENREEIKTSNVVETVKKVPSISSQKDSCPSGTSMVMSTEQAVSCEKLPSTKTIVDETKRLDSTSDADNRSTWFDEGVSSMLSFAGLVAQDDKEADSKSATKEPVNDESNKNAPDPKVADAVPSIHLVSSIDSPEPAISAGAIDETASNAKPARSDPSWVKVDRTLSPPFTDVNKETQYKKNESEDCPPSSPFIGLGYTCKESEKKMDPDAGYDVGRTLTGLTGITGASVFSGISDDNDSPFIKAPDTSMTYTEEGELKMKTERQLSADIIDSPGASRNDSHQGAPASSRGPIDNGELNMKDQFEGKAITAGEGTNKSKLPLWKAVSDPSTGRTYYFNRLTHEATWTRPCDFKEKRKADAYWGAAHKGSTAVRSAIASSLDESIVVSKKATDEDVTESTNEDSATLTSDKPALDKPDTSVGAPTILDVNVVEYKSYDPMETLKIQHFHTRKKKPSSAGDHAQPIAPDEKLAASRSSADAVVADVFPTKPPAEKINDKPITTRPDVSTERDCPGQDRNALVLKGETTKRKLKSWRRNRTTEDEKATAADSTKDEVPRLVEGERELPAVLAPELVAGAENESLNPDETIDYSCVSESDVVEVSNATISENADSNLGGEAGFERVLSSVGKNSPTVSTSEEDHSIDTEPMRKGPFQLLKSSSQNMLSTKGNEREEKAGALNMNKSTETLPTVSTKPKRKGILQRLKLKSQKMFVITKTPNAKENDKETSLEAEVAKKTALETRNAAVHVEAKECGGNKGAGPKRTLPSEAIKDDGSADSKALKGPVAVAKVKAKEAELNQTKKVVSPQKGVSPTSVLKFVNVGDEEFAVSKELKSQRPIWKTAVDPDSGRTYYYHRITRQSTWTEPDDYYEPNVDSTNDGHEQVSIDRESVRCKLDDKFAASEDKKFVVRSVRPKQMETKVEKPTQSAKTTTESEQANETTSIWPSVQSNAWNKSISASDILGLSNNLALLEQVVEDPFKATLLMKGELEKVAQMFQQEESASPGNTTVPVAVTDAVKVSAKKSNEASDYPDDESSCMAPCDEIRGSLADKEEVKQEARVVARTTTAETSKSAAQHEKPAKAKTQKSGSAKTGKVWEDLLFL